MLAGADLHITLFISSLHTGGTQRQMVALASGLVEQDVTVDLVTVYPGGEFWDEAAIYSGVNLVSLFERRPAGRLAKAFDVLRAPARLRGLVGSSRPDVLYSMLDLSNLLARIACAGLRQGPLLVWGIRSSARQKDYRSLIPYWLCKYSSGSVPLVVANSARGLETHLQNGFRYGHGQVVHNGIDAERFQFDQKRRDELRRSWAIREDQKLAVLVGRLDQRKGHEVFLAAANLLHKEKRGFRFVCVGPGPAAYRSKLERLAVQLKIERSVQFINATKGMRAVYSAADIVVSASTSEGFPNVIGEAMSCGRACVVTDVGDSAALLGDCGLVVSPNDAKALADAIIQASEDSSRMGACGRARVVEIFSIEDMATNTHKVLHDELEQIQGSINDKAPE